MGFSVCSVETHVINFHAKPYFSVLLTDKQMSSSSEIRKVIGVVGHFKNPLLMYYIEMYEYTLIL